MSDFYKEVCVCCGQQTLKKRFSFKTTDTYICKNSCIFSEPKINTNKDWFVCENQPIEESRKLIIPENCLTLWNSRTIHANEGIFKPGTSFNRLTCYVTFQPKKFRKEKYSYNLLGRLLEQSYILI